MATDTRTTLLQALQALYQSQNKEIRDRANAWLEQFQQTVEAWSICDSILHDSASSQEARYFCSQTLRTKIERDFDELPPGAAQSLRDSFMVLLLKYSTGNPQVRTQLCIAIAGLAAHVPASEWDGNQIAWLADRMGREPQGTGLPCMLQLLAVLPEEAGSYKPAVRPERRRSFIQELEGATGKALEILVSCLQVQGPAVREQVLQAFASWMRMQKRPASNAGSLTNHPLVLAALESLADPGAFDAAVDSVTEVIWATGGGESGVIDPEAFPLVQIIVPRVMGLRPRFAACLAGDDDCEDDEETAKGMARLFAEVGEAYVGLICTGRAEVLAPVEALLEVAAHPETDIALISFNFWHRLSRALTSKILPLAEEGGYAAAESERDRRRQLFVPAYGRLVALIRGRVRYPDDFEGWRPDERADFKRQRYAVADVLIDAAAVLGGSSTLQLLSEPLQELSASVAAGGAFEWRAAEAALYCIRSVAKMAPDRSDPLLPQLLAMLPTLPKQPQLLYTSALAIAAYADWLADAIQAGQAAELLPPLLELLTNCLGGDPDASSSAALALMQICDACAVPLAAYLGPLMDVYNRVLGQDHSGDKGGAAAGTPGTICIDDVLHVVQAVSLVVAGLPEEQARQGLHALLAPVVSGLQRVIDAGGATEGTLITGVDKIATVFRYVGHRQAVAEAMGGVWPIQEKVLQIAGHDSRVVEHVCRSCKHALRSAGVAAAPIVPALMATVPTLFRAHPHASYLYLVGELVKVFGRDPCHEQSLTTLVVELMSCVGQILRTLNDFNEHPDLADDFFLLAGRCLSYCPRSVLSAPVAAGLLDVSLAGLLVQHRDACTSILAFLTRLVGREYLQGLNQEAAVVVQGALLPRGAALVRLLVQGVAGALPSARLEELNDVLGALLRSCQDKVRGKTLNPKP